MNHRQFTSALNIGLADRIGTRTDLIPDEPWRDQANCIDAPPNTFHPKLGQTREQLAVHAEKWCSECPVRSECREASRGEVWGYWGGIFLEADNGARRRHRERQKEAS